MIMEACQVFNLRADSVVLVYSSFWYFLYFSDPWSFCPLVWKEIP